MGDLFPPKGLPADPEEVLPKLRRVINGEYGGLRIEVTDVHCELDRMNVKTNIFDEHGSHVGFANRTFHNTPDGLVVEHTKFWLNPHIRGNGCATEFNNVMFDWYERSGVSGVHLQANIDVGSYAWARQGFDFSNQQQAVKAIKPRLNKEIENAEHEVKRLGQERGSLPDGPERWDMDNQIRELHSTIDDAKKARMGFKVGSPDFPKAKTIADLGRPPGLLPGQSRDLSWLGKRVFMEREVKILWHGVKRFEKE